MHDSTWQNCMHEQPISLCSRLSLSHCPQHTTHTHTHIYIYMYICSDIHIYIYIYIFAPCPRRQHWKKHIGSQELKCGRRGYVQILGIMCGVAAKNQETCSNLPCHVRHGCEFPICSCKPQRWASIAVRTWSKIHDPDRNVCRNSIILT